MEIIDFDRLLNIFNEEKYYIYGAGGVADNLIRMLEEKGLERNFQGFIVTKKTRTEHSGYPLKNVDEIDLGDYSVLIAVHYVNLHEIQDNLNKHIGRDGIWIVPYLIQLEYGAPVYSNCPLRINNVINNMQMKYVWAAYHLAICEFFEGNEEDGSDAYKRIQSLVSYDEKTVNRRWEIFGDRIKAWKTGKKDDYAIKTNFDGSIILDGMHKLALAYYFGEDYVKCDVYQNIEQDIVFKKKRIYIDTEEKAKTIFTTREYIKLTEIVNEFQRRVN